MVKASIFFRATHKRTNYVIVLCFVDASTHQETHREICSSHHMHHLQNTHHRVNTCDLPLAPRGGRTNKNQRPKDSLFQCGRLGQNKSSPLQCPLGHKHLAKSLRPLWNTLSARSRRRCARYPKLTWDRWSLLSDAYPIPRPG